MTPFINIKKLIWNYVMKLKPFLLKGPFLNAWVKIKIKKWQKNYLHSLVSFQPDKTTKQEIFITPKKEKLKTILVICNQMWEKRELLPELNSLAPTTLLDIKEFLVGDSIQIESIQEAIRKSLKNRKADITLLYLNSRWLSEELFFAVRSNSQGPLLGMNLDDKAEFFQFGPGERKATEYGKWIKYFDLNLSNCKFFKEIYQRHGGSYYYFPQGLHIPENIGPPRNETFKIETGFVGSAKPERARLVKKLQEIGIEVKTFGQGWPFGNYVEQPSRLFRETQINLGLGLASGSETLTTVKNRDLECPGIGACYLTTYNFELCDLWEIGKEILCYRSLEELVEMITFYRGKPDLCRTVAQNAYHKSVREHRWRTRFKTIFQELGFRL